MNKFWTYLCILGLICFVYFFIKKEIEYKNSNYVEITNNINEKL